MAAALAQGLGNPSSVHRAGRSSRKLLEDARAAVAGSVGARPSDVVFTSGGTEACNLGVLGVLGEVGTRGHVVSTDIEHPAVARSLDAHERAGGRVTRLPVEHGRVPSVAQLSAAIEADTALVAVQWVNHETGSVLPVEDYAVLCETRGLPLFVDGTQALGKLPIDLERVPITMLALAAHKMGGPAGAGALVTRRAQPLESRQLGGGQERGRRAGSPDVVAYAGFGAACLAVPERLALQEQIGWVRDGLQRCLVELGGQVNGADGPRVATATNVSFSGLRGADLVAALDIEGLCVASGAACSSGVAEPSPVLRAMYPGDVARALGALRLTLGPESCEVDPSQCHGLLRTVVGRFRNSP